MGKQVMTFLLLFAKYFDEFFYEFGFFASAVFAVNIGVNTKDTRLYYRLTLPPNVASHD